MPALSDTSNHVTLAPLSVRIPENLKRGMAAIALRDNSSMTEVVGRALSQFLEAEQGKASQGDRLEALEAKVERLTLLLVGGGDRHELGRNLAARMEAAGLGQ